MADILTIEKKKAHQTYKLADGTKAPGASTIAKVAGAYNSQGVLMSWANRQGLDGNDIKNVSREAMDIGTIAHFLTDRWIDKKKYDLSNCSKENIEKAENALIKFGSWYDQGGFSCIANEVQMVNEELRCGGTLDNVLIDPTGKRILIDKKTSSGIYLESWVQVAGLKYMWDSIHPDQIIDEVAIVRIGKEEDMDDFEVQTKGNVGKYFQCFKAGCSLYWALKEVK